MSRQIYHCGAPKTNHGLYGKLPPSSYDFAEIDRHLGSTNPFPVILSRPDPDYDENVNASLVFTQLETPVETGKSHDRTTEKRYLTVVQSTPNKEKDTVFTHIGRHPVNRLKMAVVNPGSGKSAITDYRVLHQVDDGTCLISCDLHTGRTHQIRVHMVHIGTPILGDPIYAKPNRQCVQPGRLMLHAWQLVIDHPSSGERMAFQAPIPSQYQPWTKDANL